MLPGTSGKSPLCLGSPAFVANDPEQTKLLSPGVLPSTLRVWPDVLTGSRKPKIPLQTKRHGERKRCSGPSSLHVSWSWSVQGFQQFSKVNRAGMWSQKLDGGQCLMLADEEGVV